MSAFGFVGFILLIYVHVVMSEMTYMYTHLLSLVIKMRFGLLHWPSILNKKRRALQSAPERCHSLVQGGDVKVHQRPMALRQ